MRLARIAVGTLVGFAAATSQAASPICKDYASALHDMAAVDQALRSRWELAEPTVGGTPRIVQLTAIVDRQNTARLKTFVKACGWPKRSVQGNAAVNDAWLLAQHADHDVRFQEVVLGLLRVAVDKGEAPGDQLAFLSDRVATSRGMPQLYGTQLDVKGECEIEFRALDDRAKVEARRKAIGWPALDDYKRMVMNSAMPEKCRGQ